MNATIDLDELLRALYFAPFPLIVLNQNRNIRMINWSAEKLFVTTQAQCEGQHITRFVSAPSNNGLQNALAQAAERTRDGSRVGHLTANLTFKDEEHRFFDAELSVSAWQPSDYLFSQDAAAPLSLPILPAPHLSDTRETQNIGPILHDAYYTLGFRQTSDGRRDNVVDYSSNAASSVELLDNVVESLDCCIYIISSDCNRSATNAACKQLVNKFGIGFPDSLSGPLWVHARLKIYDENFREEYDQESFLYAAATRGEVTPEGVYGWENALTGARFLVQMSCMPLRDKDGRLIGGLLRFSDATEREKLQNEEVQAKGEEYFKLVCDSMPQLVWTTSPNGYHDKGWWEFTGLSKRAGDSMGVGWQNSFHPEDMPEANRIWSHSLRTGDPYSVQYRCRRKDGVWRWVLGRALPLRDQSGNILKWFGTCTDIHETVEALYASRKSQAQLASVINHANVTLWAVDKQGIITVAEGPGLRQLKLGGSPGTSADGSSASTSHTVSDSSQSQNAPSESHPLQRHSGSTQSFTSAPSHSTSQSLSQTHEGSRHAKDTSGSGSAVTMIGRSIYDLWDPDVKQHVERALRGDTITREMEVEGRWFRTSYTPMREREMYRAAMDVMTEAKSVITGVVGASLDITEIKRAAKMIEEARIDSAAAKEASKLKGEFLANMSHEIRTPIAGVIGMSELLCATELDKEQREYAENILRSGDALLTVLNDILDFSKIEIGKLEIENSPFRLDLVIQDTMKMLSFATQKKGLRFTQDTRLDGIEYVVGDGGRIRQVLTNLLTNAIKFTKEGSITLRAYEEASNERMARVRFQVVDTGVGISSTQLSKLFRPFSQADSSTARRFGGTGLGLAISKNLVELMKGEIGLESQEGTGSTAWFSIPFKKVKNPTASDKIEPLHRFSPRDSIANIIESPSNDYDILQAAQQRVITDQAQPIRKAREGKWILIAEDNLMNQQIALQMLKKMGYQAYAVNNGRESLTEIDNKPYSLVLMDCQMPEMDGYEATSAIRALGGSRKDIPIIAMTASAIRGDRERCLEAGMSDYLAKPVKRVTLEAMINKWLPVEPSDQPMETPHLLRPTAPIPSRSFVEVAASNNAHLSSKSSPTDSVNTTPQNGSPPSSPQDTASLLTPTPIVETPKKTSPFPKFYNGPTGNGNASGPITGSPTRSPKQ